MSRLFSDGEELDATTFARALAEGLGIAGGHPADGDTGVLRCVG
jgi:hypothetical protein